VVLSRSATALVPTLIVPDEQTWTMSGNDPASLGIEPCFAAARVRRVLVPERLPEVLAEPLERVLEGVPPDVERPTLASSPDGHGHHEGHGDEGHDHGGHDQHEDHGGQDHDGGHDHDDMMAIVGDPSADGLVMEPLEFRFGPLGTPLPGGLVAAVTLDGDVVAECEVTAVLAADDDGASPDPLAPQAWQAALAGAHEAAVGVPVPPAERWTRIARVEAERALSHAAWLRAFARLLGWPVLVERTNRAVVAALEAQRLSGHTLEEALSGLRDLAGFVEGSRTFRWRTAGRAPVSRRRARQLGLHGPIARASGLVVDARLDDPFYRRLDFEPVVRSEGDALARTLVRVREAVGSVDLAIRALQAATGGGLADALHTVEGPRGRLHVRLDGSQVHASAPGAAAALAVAGEAVVGAEWTAALIGLASFDLSPWRVAG
jgi:hypothetical protein